jgi:hypothetical protein
MKRPERTEDQGVWEDGTTKEVTPTEIKTGYWMEIAQDRGWKKLFPGGPGLTKPARTRQ